MAEQLIEGVKPTRMQLLEIRKKIILAEKGHKLLEEKRDALVERFLSIIKDRNTLKNEIHIFFENGFISLIQSQMILGEQKVEEISKLSESIGEITLQKDNIMGVKIPKMNRDNIKIQTKPKYGFMETCSKLDDTQQNFSKIIIKLLDLAGIEGGIRSLAIEIEKTKRRVNVLENTLIPKLHATQKYIEMQLEEREREDFFRRKRIKALMETKRLEEMRA